MIENQLADRMRAALADEPPLGFDPAEVADRASRVRRRRRSKLAATGATAGVLAIAVTAVVMTGTGGPASDVGARVSTTQNPDAACPSVPPDGRPPLNFPGSDQIVARLEEAAPRVIAKHLPGVSVQPSETGMIAYDCPPNVGTLYRVNGADQTVMVYLIHARGGGFDLDNDRYAEDPTYRLLAEQQEADGTWSRTYDYSNDGGKTGGAAGAALIVVRFGLDGMVTEAGLSGTGPLVAGRLELEALASDPELRF